MSQHRRVFLTLFAAFYLITLSGCETANEQWTSLKSGFEDIEWPQFRARENAEISEAARAEETAPEPQTKLQPKSQSMATLDIEKNMDGCPKTGIVKDLGSLHQFSEAGPQAFSNNISSIRITGVDNSCTYNENSIVVNIGLTFEGELGPQARIWQSERPSFSYPYFIAVTTSQGSILAKEVFTVDMTYAPDQARRVKRENMRQIIPLNGGRYNRDVELLIGFQLTDEQLRYNRGKSFSAAGIEPSAGVTERAPQQQQSVPGTGAPVDLTGSY